MARAMTYQLGPITLPAAAQLTPGHLCGINATTANAEACATEGLLAIGAVIQSEASAPYATLILPFGPIAELISDGAGAIAPGDILTVGATAGQVKVRTPADGTAHRTALAIALSAAAATQGLTVRAMLLPAHYIGA